MNIITDNIQVRVTIPKKFVEKFDIQRDDMFEFDDSGKTLTGKLIKD